MRQWKPIYENVAASLLLLLALADVSHVAQGAKANLGLSNKIQDVSFVDDNRYFATPVIVSHSVSISAIGFVPARSGDKVELSVYASVRNPKGGLDAGKILGHTKSTVTEKDVAVVLDLVGGVAGLAPGTYFVGGNFQQSGSAVGAVPVYAQVSTWRNYSIVVDTVSFGELTSDLGGTNWDDVPRPSLEYAVYAVEFEEPPPGVTAVSLIMIIILISFSGLFSGLTLGLLGLDVTGLEIVIAGEDEEAAHAKKILPIRRRGNWLLCTLLLGNVMVNTALSILMADITSGLIGFISSTLMIVVFGEIIPQAYCSRYALAIGARVVWLVRILMYLLAVFAYPLSVLLDRMLGRELPTIYDNKELAKLIAIHAGDQDSQLDSDQAQVMKGALEVADKTVKDVMTPWSTVFCMRINENLDFDKLTRVFKSGHSRIPILDEDDDYKVVGLLLVKDLILIDPEDEIPVKSIVNLYGREIDSVFPNYRLMDMLQEFRKGRSHMAVVRDVIEVKNGEPVYRTLGIVTLEDIIESILRINIVDETDLYVDRHHLKEVEGRTVDDHTLRLFDYRRALPDSSVTPQETQAIFFHLRGTADVFQRVQDTSLKALIQNQSDVRKVLLDSKDPAQKTLFVHESGSMLYEFGRRSEYFTLILDGRVEVLAGREQFRSELGRWSVLAPEALEDVVVERELHDTPPFVPDFTCRCIKNTRVMRISRGAFHAALRDPTGRPRRTTSFVALASLAESGQDALVASLASDTDSPQPQPQQEQPSGRLTPVMQEGGSFSSSAPPGEYSNGKPTTSNPASSDEERRAVV